MDKPTLLGKWWYRLLQVFFFIIFSIVFASVFYIYYTDGKPENIIDKDKSFVKCNNGMTFNYGGNNNIYPMNDAELYLFDDQRARKTCSGVLGEDGKYIESQNIPNEKNYSLVNVYKQDKPWSDFYKLLVYVSGSVILVFWLIRRIFFYVVLREGFFRI